MNLNQQNKYGDTSLSLAIQWGHEAVVKVLLDQEASQKRAQRIGPWLENFVLKPPPTVPIVAVEPRRTGVGGAAVVIVPVLVASPAGSGFGAARVRHGDGAVAGQGAATVARLAVDHPHYFVRLEGGSWIVGLVF